MTDRTLELTVTLTVPDDADDEAVADYVMDLLCHVLRQRGVALQGCPGPYR